MTDPEDRLREIQKQAEMVKRVFKKQDVLFLDDLIFLMDEGMSAGQAIDYIAVEKFDYGYVEWGDKRGVSRQSVYKNVERAKSKI